jgi:WD40 repeat protein
VSSGETLGLASSTAGYQKEAFDGKVSYGGGLIGMTRGSKGYWYGFEALGTVRQLMGSQGQVVDAYAFDAWGNELTNPQSQVPNPFKYVGKQRRQNFMRLSILVIISSTLIITIKTLCSNNSKFSILYILEHNKNNKVYSLALSPDGKYLASGGYDHIVKIWDISCKRLIRTLKRHKSGITCVTFSPDGKLLASSTGQAGEGSANPSFEPEFIVKLWRSTEGHLVKTFGHNCHIWGVRFFPEGRLLASADDEVVKIWDVFTGRLVKVLKPLKIRGINGFAVSPDGRFLAIGEPLYGISLWRRLSKYNFKLKHVLAFDNEAETCAITFSPNSQIIAAADGRDSVVRLWRVSDGKLIKKYDVYDVVPMEAISSLAFSPNGRFLAVGGYVGVVIIDLYKNYIKKFLVKILI